MKIAQVIHSGPPAWATGGPTKNVFELSKELVKRGHDVTLLTTDLYKPKQRWVSYTNPEYFDGIRVFRFKNISNWLAYKHHISISPAIREYLREHLHEYDIVHLQDLISLLAIETTKYCKKHQIPYILTTRGSIPWLSEKKLLNRLYNKLWGVSIVRNATKVTALSQMEAEQYKSIGVSEDKIEIVPNGINLAEFESLPHRGEFKRRYQLGEDQRLVLYLGRIHQSKGIDLLANAFAKLSREMDNTRLVIIGPDDGYLPALKRLVRELKIEKKVLFTGPLYNEDKLRAYVDADVFVNPRPDEIFGVVFLEAIACGTPVICSKGCGIADVIDGKAGFATSQDKDELGNALLRMLTDDELRQEFEKRGKEIVREQFSWSSIAGSLEEIYSRCS